MDFPKVLDGDTFLIDAINTDQRQQNVLVCMAKTHIMLAVWSVVLTVVLTVVRTTVPMLEGGE